MKRVELTLYYILFITLGASWACRISSSQEEDIHFEKGFYKATIIDHRIDIIDGPIKLSQCESQDVRFEVTSDESKYYPFFASYSPTNCLLAFYGLVRENVTGEDTLYDVLTLNAYVDDYVVRTSVIVINSAEYDPYKLVYNVNGTEYVILNYVYFKLFLLLIVILGILILVLEIREIIVKYKGKMYAQLDDHVNYI